MSGDGENFRPDSLAGELRQKYGEVEGDRPGGDRRFSLAGRLMFKREMGKAGFGELRDSTGQMQIYLRRDEVGGEVYDAFARAGLGDWVGVSGTLMRTRKGEFTLRVERFVVVLRCLRPLPDKYHGLVDRETIARHRHLELMIGGHELVRARAAMNREIRQFLDQRRFVEVETPMMHPIPGGANARPFVTHLNSLHRDLYLRVAPELYLKRLLVGGMDRVYELNRNFRNEGVSSRHNPEFTMLEFYQAWADWQDGMALTEELILHLATTVGDAGIDLNPPFARRSMTRAVADKFNLTPEQVADPTQLRQLAETLPQAAGAADGRERTWSDWNDWGQLLVHLFEKSVEPDLQTPTFITHFPLSVSPLARRCTTATPEDGAPHPLTERWELLIGGREIAGGFSELNDAQDQSARLKQQSDRKGQGDEEAMHYDKDFIAALEYGMPPATGVGVGLDRLLVLLTGADSIRQVILFPQLRDNPNE